jgi:hypothetical protein
MNLPWGSSLSRGVEMSASLPATDVTSNASSGPPCVGQQGQSYQVLGFPNWNRAYDIASVRILLFLVVQGKHVAMMPRH